MKFHIWISQEINENCDFTICYRSSSLSTHLFLSIRSVGSGVGCKKRERERLNVLQHTQANVTMPKYFC